MSIKSYILSNSFRNIEQIDLCCSIRKIVQVLCIRAHLQILCENYAILSICFYLGLSDISNRKSCSCAHSVATLWFCGINIYAKYWHCSLSIRVNHLLFFELFGPLQSINGSTSNGIGRMLEQAENGNRDGDWLEQFSYWRFVSCHFLWYPHRQLLS